MANVAKLKERARTLEQREQWKEALDVYQEIAAEAAGDEVEVGLWNRIGDLQLRVGQTDRALEAYDRAVDAYAEAGLHNNAIALCRKILRLSPGRSSVYLKLGQISAARGFLADARQNFLEYAARMQRAGQLDASFAALKEFADLSPDDTETRLLLADQLRSHGREHEALEQLRILLARLRERGMDSAATDVEQRILAIDPDADLTAPVAERAQRPAAEAADELALNFYGTIDPGAIEPGTVEQEAPDAWPLPGLDPSLPGNEVEPGEIPPLEGLDTGGIEGLVATGTLEGLETSQEFAGLGGSREDGPDALPLHDTGLEPTTLSGPSTDFGEIIPLHGDEEEGDGESLPLLDLDAGFGSAPEADAAPEAEREPGAEGEPLDLILPEIESAPAPAPADPLEELRKRAASAPEDTASLYRLVDLLEDRGSPDEAVAVLASAHRDLGARGMYREAIDAVRSLLVRRPDDTALYQKQVEYAFRAADTELMVRAYLDLGRHLGSPVDNAKSRAVYQRVLELDPGNDEARRTLAPSPLPAPRPEAPAAPRGDYVDLGALILDDEEESGERSTRFVVEEEEPTGDEDRDFAEMLSVFRQKVNESIGAEDSASHYDLGLAFMEMGLIDEAISEFQVALRGGANPLATLELLGRCFTEKGQHAVATRVLERALRIPGTGESEVVGVAYQLGRCHEEMGNPAAAREMYERVLAFDIGFRDTLARLETLRASSGSGF